MSVCVHVSILLSCMHAPSTDIHDIVQLVCMQSDISSIGRSGAS